jgi:hypothetical protein
VTVSEKSQERIQTLHPDPAKSGPRILTWKYDAVRRAILETLTPVEPGIPFRDLNGAVAGRLTEEESASMGSVPWYVATVKLDLEARGEIARVPGARPQRLIRTA